MIVSQLWAEACLENKKNIEKAEDFEVTDEDLGGEHGPYRSRKRREERKSTITYWL